MKSLHPDLHIPDNVTVSDYVLQHIQNYGSRIAYIDGHSGTQITYAEGREMIGWLARALWHHGMRSGDVMLVLQPNCVEYPFLMLATVSLGAIFAPVNHNSSTEEIAYFLNDTGCKFVFTNNEFLDRVQKAIEIRNAQQRSVCVITYAPQGAGLHLQGLVATGRDLAALPGFFYMGVEAEDAGAVALGFLPFYHSYALMYSQLWALCRGITVVLMTRYDLRTMLHLIQQYRISMVPLVPPVALDLIKSPLVDEYDLSSVKVIVIGAAPLLLESSRSLQRRLMNAVIKIGYGLTEAAPIVTFAGPTRYTEGSVGELFPNMEAKVVDVENGQELGAGKRGELWIKGPNIMAGYWRNPEATENTIDAQGWMRTGDIVTYDENGSFYIVDRLKELIKYKGHQVAPAVLEDILTSHPAVDDVAVIGIPDDNAGELPKAFIVLKAAHKTTREDIQSFVKDKLSSQYWLRGGVAFVETIPKSPSGKILRRQLRQSTEKSKL